MLIPIDRTRPSRSPSQPNTKPPIAAPKRNAALYHENQRGTIFLSASASPLIGGCGSPPILGATNSRFTCSIWLADNCPLRKNSVVADRAVSVITAIWKPENVQPKKAAARMM
jgi:hypothetical protein